MRLKVIAMLGALALATTASAQVLNEELPGEAVLSGEANRQLEDIGRRAAEQGLVLQVNAPDLWEAEILTPVRRGAGDTRLEVKFVNTLRDTVIIRGVKAGDSEDPLETLKRITNNAKARSIQPEDGPANASAPAPAQQPGKPASSSPPDIERPSMDVPEVKVARPRAALPETDPRASSRRAREEKTEAAVSVSPPEAGERSALASAPSERDADDAAEEAERFEDIYNDGRPIRRSLGPDDLEAGDLVFRGNFHDVVVRRGISTEVFWLEGHAPSERLEHQERNRYRVAGLESQPDESDDDRVEMPGDESERERFERLYNQGRSIEQTIGVSALQPEDELYVGDTVSVVLRRSKVSIDAYWLSGPVNLDQPAIEHDEKNKYRVVGKVE